MELCKPHRCFMNRQDGCLHSHSPTLATYRSAVVTCNYPSSCGNSGILYMCIHTHTHISIDACKVMSYTVNAAQNLKFLKGKVLVAQLCLTLFNCMDCSLPGSSVHGILQARMLEWVAIYSSRGSSQRRNRIWLSNVTGRFFTV